mmetsp:Transcript_8228/g.17982  ORF Transcript_8228/g.17982 Transcript_8228/m.17982 type:complete len:485 (+) Transcript_8228:305-1759(+)
MRSLGWLNFFMVLHGRAQPAVRPRSIVLAGDHDDRAGGHLRGWLGRRRRCDGDGGTARIDRVRAEADGGGPVARGGVGRADTRGDAHVLGIDQVEVLGGGTGARRAAIVGVVARGGATLLPKRAGLVVGVAVGLVEAREHFLAHRRSREQDEGVDNRLCGDEEGSDHLEGDWRRVVEGVDDDGDNEEGPRAEEGCDKRAAASEDGEGVGDGDGRGGAAAGAPGEIGDDHVARDGDGGRREEDDDGDAAGDERVPFGVVAEQATVRSERTLGLRGDGNAEANEPRQRHQGEESHARGYPAYVAAHSLEEDRQRARGDDRRAEEGGVDGARRQESKGVARALGHLLTVEKVDPVEDEVGGRQDEVGDGDGQEGAHHRLLEHAVAQVFVEHEQREQQADAKQEHRERPEDPLLVGRRNRRLACARDTKVGRRLRIVGRACAIRFVALVQTLGELAAAGHLARRRQARTHARAQLLVVRHGVLLNLVR